MMIIDMKNIQLILGYEGTHYLGWQKTKEGISIEEELERALRQLLQHPVSLQAASRTDRGVHADGQVVNFFTDKTFAFDKLKHSLNALLPKDIRIYLARQMPLSFHPTLSAIGKEYHYYVCLGLVQNPRYRHFSWHFVKPIQMDFMQKGAFHLLGTHDFSALTNEVKANNICHIQDITIQSLEENRLLFKISGSRFLYKMVRNIVGTLLYVGCGKISQADLPILLASRDRKQMGMTAAACGLSLKKVFYDGTK